jgi:hypothetical protein
MPKETNWTVVESTAVRGVEHLLKLARGAEVCEAQVHVGYGRGAAHEPLTPSVSVESVRVVRGFRRNVDLEVERWLEEHADDVVTITEDGPPEVPCALCGTETRAELLEDMGDEAPLLGFCCPECVERIACEEHEDGCACSGCESERARHERVRLALDARGFGGVSVEGMALLFGVEPGE